MLTAWSKNEPRSELFVISQKDSPKLQFAKALLGSNRVESNVELDDEQVEDY